MILFFADIMRLGNKDDAQTLSLPRWGEVAHRKTNIRLLLYIGGVADEVVFENDINNCRIKTRVQFYMSAETP